MMYAWKFIVGLTPVPLPDTPGSWVNQSVAVVISDTEQNARERLRFWAIEQGFDYRFLEVASVRRLELANGAVLAWAQGF